VGGAGRDRRGIVLRVAGAFPRRSSTREASVRRARGAVADVDDEKCVY